MNFIGQITGVRLEEAIRIITTEIYEGMTKESRQICPPGIDANPILEDQGVLIIIDKVPGKSAQVGVYPDSQAEQGEVRIYSRAANGDLKALMWFKADGTIEINGSEDNAVRYSQLETAFNTFKTDFNNFISTVFNLHMHPTAGTGPPSLPTLTGTSTTADIAPAKVDEVKLP
jgi:hypothetical protein